MDFPVYIHLFSVNLLLHTVMEVLGMGIGFRYFLYLRKKQGDVLDPDKRRLIVLGAIFGALLGSRLVGGFENPLALYHSDNPLLYFYQNKTVVGGFIGGLLGVELIKRIVGEKQRSGDLFTYPMILALMIGRIGCFSMGIHEQTYGNQTSLFTGMNLGDGISRHPVALYEIAVLFLLWVCIRKIEVKFTLQEGARFKLFMIGYLAFRFMLDFIKPHYTYPFGLSTIQLACLIGLGWYCKYIFDPVKLLKSNAGTSLYLL